MWTALQEAAAPSIEIGRHCTTPYPCPFYGHCHEGLPEHHIEQLPRANEGLLDKLLQAGVNDIRDIPREFPALSAMQQRVRDCVVSGRPYIDPELSTTLSQLEHPLRFLDFETFNPALPIYSGTRPYQVVPFQWSMHVQPADGGLNHQAFLQYGTNDPRPAFIESLVEAAGNSGTIVVYSGYEETILRGLSSDFPEYAERLLALCGRMLDLLKPIRSYYYHPDQHGSFSLKSVLPIFAPDLGYKDLEIQEGTLASAAFARMIATDTPDVERNPIREALLAYCHRDTLAMVRILESLRVV